MFLANLGPIAVHTARATFAKNLFEVAGIRAIGDDWFDTAEPAAAAFVADGARLACICSSDAVYAESAGRGRRDCAEGGGRRRGCSSPASPGDRRAEYVAAGVDEFVFVGADAESNPRRRPRPRWSGHDA